MAFDWTEILDYVRFTSLASRWYKIDSSLINWSLIPQHPACQTIDVAKYINLRNNTPMYLKLVFKKVSNLTMTLLIEDKRKALLKRSLRSNIMDYDGPRIEIDLMDPMSLNYYLTISQTIDIETDTGKACKNYPSPDFTSYSDCDEEFVYDQMKNTYKLMPFWGAKKIDEVTKFEYRIILFDLKKLCLIFSMKVL